MNNAYISHNFLGLNMDTNAINQFKNEAKNCAISNHNFVTTAELTSVVKGKKN